MKNRLKPLNLNHIGHYTGMSILSIMFLLLSAALSIEWQVQNLFLPIIGSKKQVEVAFTQECLNWLDDQKLRSPSRCIECEKIEPRRQKIGKCFFVTTGDDFEIAKSLINLYGSRFSTTAYVFRDKVYLKYKIHPLLWIHIPVWLFGVTPLIMMIFIPPERFSKRVLS